jgi:FkbH-like protein
MESIRRTQTFRLRTGTERKSTDQLLREVQGRLTFSIGRLVDDGRALELINKTNQFNLNGKRHNPETWSSLFRDPRIQGVIASYEDKYGKLGKVAVLIGRLSEKQLTLENWVMSCRAFSRRIEYQCIQYLYDRFGVSEIKFEVQPTASNGPMIEFLQQWTDHPVQGALTLDRLSFLQRAPRLPHAMSEEAIL